MGEKLKEENGSTKQRVNEVNTGLEGYHNCVDAMVQWREEEFEFCKHQGGCLVQKLETCVIERERVLVDKVVWESRLNGGKDG